MSNAIVHDDKFMFASWSGSPAGAAGREMLDSRALDSAYDDGLDCNSDKSLVPLDQVPCVEPAGFRVF